MAITPKDRGGGAVAVLCGLIVFGCTLTALNRYNGDDAKTGQVAEMLDAAGKLRPVAEIAKTLTQSKLIAVEFETPVRTSSEDSIWRGTARASIEVPVKMGYGVDLAKVDADAIDLWAGARWLFVTLPAPTLLTVEPQLDRMEERIEVSGLRSRARSGDTQRQLALRNLEIEARKLVLLPEQRRDIEDKTREQIEKLLRSLLSDRYGIRVTFADR